MKPTREDVIDAVRTILRFISDDGCEHEGLLDTPERVVKSYDELFCGYGIDIGDILSTRFHEISEFRDIVFLSGIKFYSMCEHHMMPIIGSVDIAYIPNGSVVGISKLARVVEAFARRLQIQERMTAQISEAIQKHLNPAGTAVRITATHHCMTLRGVMQDNNNMNTMHFTGAFVDDIKYRTSFLQMIR
jgi:GTP cyclohydrolase I